MATAAFRPHTAYFPVQLSQPLQWTSLSYRWGHYGSERVGHLSEATQPLYKDHALSSLLRAPINLDEAVTLRYHWRKCCKQIKEQLDKRRYTEGSDWLPEKYILCAAQKEREDLVC